MMFLRLKRLLFGGLFVLVGKNIGLFAEKNWFVEFVIGKSNIHFPGMFDAGTLCAQFDYVARI